MWSLFYFLFFVSRVSVLLRAAQEGSESGRRGVEDGLLLPSCAALDQAVAASVAPRPRGSWFSTLLRPLFCGVINDRWPGRFVLRRR
jgi:hypothetical protein